MSKAGEYDTSMIDISRDEFDQSKNLGNISKF